MRQRLLMILALLGAGEVAALTSPQPGYTDTPLLPGGSWRVHDSARPYPRPVAPSDVPGGPPADAVILFDGRSQAAWKGSRGPWGLADGVLTVRPGSGGSTANNLATVAGFGDVQLHLEFRIPPPGGVQGQDRGNSGIWFMQRYEVQILDGVDNPTYADGTVGALYGWKPPLVNAARPAGQWQNYDIVFERPRFAVDGKLVRPAFATVLLNGVLVQNRQSFLGSTVWRRVADYVPHAEKLPIELQDHGAAVSFRNIWVRNLPAAEEDTR